jgi:glycosyltransferase involved in cell wall biosynthesis
MKIAFLTKMRMPEERGIAFALAMMCQSFAKLGWETSLVAPKRRQPQSLRKETVWSYFQVKSAVFKVAFLPSFELPWGTPGEPIFSHLRYFVMSWLFSFAAVWHLTLHKYEVVYLFPDCKELLVILRFWPFCKSFVVHEVHHPPYERYLQIYDKLGVPRTDLIVGNTQSNASYYARNGVIENKAIGAHVGVSLEDYDYQTPKSQLRRKLKLPVSKTIIGFGGRFVALGMEKGISELIIAFSRLRKKYKNIYLACVGGPDTYVSKYIKEARNLGLANSDFAILDGVP